MIRFRENDIVGLVGPAPPYDLAESVGPNLRLAELLDASTASGLADMSLSYATAEGDPSLRKAIAASHGVSSENVVITVGAMHALFLIAYILCDRGDEAVTTSPLFPPARGALDIVGSNLRVLTLSFDQGYQIDMSQFRVQLSPRTKLVSLASPQNPSGVAIPAKTLRDILMVMEDLCPAAHLLIDETYREATYGDDPVATSAITLSEKVISVASLSKCHGAPGLRLGWAITRDPELRRQLVLGKFNTVISCSPVDEVLALRLLAQRDWIVAERRRQLAAGLAKTADWISENRDFVEWVRPDAGALCCVRLKPSVFDDVAINRFYDELARTGVRVANGTWFGDDARVFRLGFGFLAMPDLQAALENLASALRRRERPRDVR